MKIKYRGEDKIIIGDDKKDFTFLDLAKINGYMIEPNTKHYWVLYQISELIKDDSIQFRLGSTYHLNGSLDLLYFGYFLNSINRRTLEINENGIVKKDFIYLFNPRNSSEVYSYRTYVPENTNLEDYLSEEIRLYESYDKKEKIRNHILDDSFIRDYIYYSNRYCNILNSYSDDFRTLNNIAERFDDEWYLKELEMNIRKSNNSKILK